MSAAKSGERAGNFLVSDLGTAARAGNGQPAEPAAAKRGSKVTFARLRAAASFAHAPHPIAFLVAYPLALFPRRRKWGRSRFLNRPITPPKSRGGAFFSANSRRAA